MYSYCSPGDDARLARALLIADHHSRWLRLRDPKTGRVIAAGIPSSRDPLYFYRVDRTSCECPDSQRHPESVCKHRLALRLAICRRQTELPAAIVIHGLERMAAGRAQEA